MKLTKLSVAKILNILYIENHNRLCSFRKVKRSILPIFYYLNQKNITYTCIELFIIFLLRNIFIMKLSLLSSLS